jgi:hypothetical protein
LAVAGAQIILAGEVRRGGLEGDVLVVHKRNVASATLASSGLDLQAGLCYG